MSFDEESGIEFDSPVEVVSSHQDLILDNTAILDKALEENLHRVDEVVPADTLNDVLANILNEDLESYETANTISSAILYIIRHYFYIDDYDSIQDDLRAWFRECKIKYEAEIDQSRTIEYIGTDGWTNIETEINIKDRDSGLVNFRHKVETIDNEMSFVSGPTGLVGLVEHLLHKMKEGTQYGVVTDEHIDRIKESVDEMAEHHHSQNERSDLLMEVLLSNTSMSQEELSDLSEEELYAELKKQRKEKQTDG